MNTLKRNWVVFCLLGSCFAGQSGTSFPQTQVVGELPVPYLAADHSIPVSQKGHRVFLDRSTGDAYVLFHSDDHDLIPIELNRHVDPQINVDINYNASSDTWEYSYSFSNSAHARQPAVSWFFKDLTADTCTVSVPDGWSYLFPSFLTNPPWPRLVIAAHGSKMGVQPGSQVAPFIVSSKLAPGLQDVYVQGETTQVPALPTEPDDVVADELKRVLGFPYNYRKAQTLGPQIKTTIEGAAGVYGQEVLRCETEGACSHEFSIRASTFLKDIENGGRDKKEEIEGLRLTGKSSIEKAFINVLTILSSKVVPAK